MTVVELATGAELRVTGPPARRGRLRERRPGRRGGGHLERIPRVARRAARAAFPGLAFAEVPRPDQVLEAPRLVRRRRACGDPTPSAPPAHAAARLLDGRRGRGPRRRTRLRWSGVLGLAPWLPDRLVARAPRAAGGSASLHGALDRRLPGIPGVSPASSRRGFERARALGVEGDYTLISGAVHGIAFRAHRGARSPLPRAGTWARLVAEELSLSRLRRAERRRRSSCAASGTFTFDTSRSFSSPRITHHETSICHLPSPCRADTGKAWWLLCQPSPKTSAATSQLLRASSRER